MNNQSEGKQTVNDMMWLGVYGLLILAVVCLGYALAAREIDKRIPQTTTQEVKEQKSIS